MDLLDEAIKSARLKVDKVAASEQSGPRCWIQWKGTDVCMDVYCECGTQSHVDDMFAYLVKCHVCGKIYHVSPHVRLVEASAEEAERLVNTTVLTH